MGISLRLEIDLAMSAIGTFDVAEGMRWLLDRLGDAELEPAVRKKLLRLNFAADARLIQERIAASFARGEIDAKSTELYFGLDPLNAPLAKGIEFGCGESPNRYSTRLEDIRSDLFKRLFTLIDGEVEQVTLGIGYLGLALKQAFREISVDVLLGTASHRGIVFGFHDGDLFELGKVTREGFEITLEFSPPKENDSPDTLEAFPWPGEESSQADWIYACGLIAARIEDEKDRVSKMQLAVESLCGMGKHREADRFMKELVKIESSLTDASQRVDILICAATVTAGLGETTSAIDFLLLAKSVAQEIQDDFWREDAEEGLVGRADRLGMLEALGTNTPEERRRAAVAKGLREAEAELHAGKPAVCRKKLAELNAQMQQEGDNVEDSHRSRLLDLCDQAGDSSLVLAVYESAPRTDWEWWRVVGPLWRHGARDEASRWLEEQFSEAENHPFLSGTGNFHHPMGQMESVAKTYWKLGAAEAFHKVLQRIEKAVSTWSLPDAGWDSAAVLTKLGSLQAKAGQASTAHSTLLKASAAIAKEPKTSFRKERWKELSAAYGDLAAWDEAIKCANKIRDPDTKRESLASVYLRAKRWADLRTLLDGVTDAAEACRFAFRMTSVFADD